MKRTLVTLILFCAVAACNDPKADFLDKIQASSRIDKKCEYRDKDGWCFKGEPNGEGWIDYQLYGGRSDTCAKVAMRTRSISSVTGRLEVSNWSGTVCCGSGGACTVEWH